MAITWSSYGYSCLSSDVKPTSHPQLGTTLPGGFVARETDTGREFTFDDVLVQWVQIYPLSTEAALPPSALVRLDALERNQRILLTYFVQMGMELPLELAAEVPLAY